MSDNKTKKIYIETYGCQMNFSDSEIVGSIMTDHQYATTNEIDSADVILINTCSIRDNAEQRVRKRITEYMPILKKRMLSLFNLRVLAWGILLGLVNFGSIFFLVKTLNYQHPLQGSIDSSVVFGINNIGIVTLSVLLGVLLFKERLSRINIAGILICILATFILTFAS